MLFFSFFFLGLLFLLEERLSLLRDAAGPVAVAVPVAVTDPDPGRGPGHGRGHGRNHDAARTARVLDELVSLSAEELRRAEIRARRSVHLAFSQR